MSRQNSATTVTLYRPVGQAELDLIATSGYQRFPPLLPQPIFYPVCNEAYAVEIAERWNARSEGVGYVTRFSVLASYFHRTRGAKRRPASRRDRADGSRWPRSSVEV